jgi:hypothetical protein
MLTVSSSPAAPRIRTELASIRASIPEGRFERVQGGDAHDRVQVLSSPRYVESYRRRVAGWIKELLAGSGDEYVGVRP